MGEISVKIHVQKLHRSAAYVTKKPALGSLEKLLRHVQSLKVTVWTIIHFKILHSIRYDQANKPNSNYWQLHREIINSDGRFSFFSLFPVWKNRKFCNVIIRSCFFSFKKNARRISRLMKDTPRTPLEKAGDWIEYLLRHGGAQHLRAQVFNIPWYQYYLLDVIAFLVALAAFVVMVVRWTCGCMFRVCFRPSSEKAKNDWSLLTRAHDVTSHPSIVTLILRNILKYSCHQVNLSQI